MARILFALVILVYLSASNLLAETESTSWGGIKAEFFNTPAGKRTVSHEKVGGDKNSKFFFTNYAVLKITLKDFCSIDCGYEFSWKDFEQGKEHAGSYYRIEYKHGPRNRWTEGWVHEWPIYHKQGGDEATVLTSIWAIYSKEDVSGLYDFRLVRVDEKKTVTEVMVWHGVPINTGRDLLELGLFSDGHKDISYSKTFAETSLSFYFEGKTGPYQQGETVVIKWSGSWGYGYREGDWVSLSLFKYTPPDFIGVFVKDIVSYYPIEKGEYRLRTKGLPAGKYLVKMTGMGYNGTIGYGFELVE